jgi:hypothetical protein
VVYIGDDEAAREYGAPGGIGGRGSSGGCTRGEWGGGWVNWGGRQLLRMADAADRW